MADIEHFGTKLADFCVKLEAEMNARIKTLYPGLHESATKEGRRGYHEIGTDFGPRFMRVWSDILGSKSVRYFVERSTGIIFGAKGWKAYNPNREYGTLDTINDWDWSDYYAVSKTGKNTLVPKGERK